MALDIEMDNRQKRKAQAMGMFLNVETQHKFLKVATHSGLSKELDIAAQTYHNLMMENAGLRTRNTDLVNQVRNLKRQAESRGWDIFNLEQENCRLNNELGHSSDARPDDEPDDKLIQ